MPESSEWNTASIVGGVGEVPETGYMHVSIEGSRKMKVAHENRDVTQMSSIWAWSAAIEIVAGARQSQFRVRRMFW